MEHIRACITCGQQIIIYRKHPISPAQQKELRKYCPTCLGGRLRITSIPPRRQEERYIDSNGYVRILVGSRHVLEHRYVMEQALGRKLRKGELVHHKDRNKQHNARQNLRLFTRRRHSSYHITLNNPNVHKSSP